MSNWYTEKYKANDLTDKIKNKVIKVPHYQRGQVWKESQKEKLIDSIKNGFPFGTILLYKKDDNTYQLIDGLQRSATIYEYLHKPAKFFRETDISEECLDKIYDLLEIYGGNKNVIKSKILIYIKDWVTLNHQTMEDVKNLNAIECAKKLKENFPTCTDGSALEIANLLMNEFQTFKDECEDLSNAEIPAIIYTGNSENLPEVFNRINSKGTTLSKYQILSATWTTYEYILMDSKLDLIVDYVDKFYISIYDKNFDVDGYDATTIRQTKKLNLYQILFGFGKLLSYKFPYLFSAAKNDKDVESCGFNLVNTCLGNKNSKISSLPLIIEETFKNDDKKISDFLVNIINCTEKIYKYLKPYIQFKLNRRDDSINIYHTEFQICSMIANLFNARYATYTFDDYDYKIIGRNIKTDCSNKLFDGFLKNFKENAFKRYLIDILNDVWGGTGDKRMDEVAINQSYYTDEITKQIMEDELNHWFNQMNSSRHEHRKIANPKSAEKILLSVIYCRSFSAYEQNNDIGYDIEHLAPKGCLKILLKEINNKDGITNGLPISSFANLCLLPDEINRKKKDKTLYQDTKYLNSIENKNISISEIENKFSFTSANDLEWINKNYNDFDELKKDYYNFLNIRFEKQKEIIIRNLFNSAIQLNNNEKINVSKKTKTVIDDNDIVNQYSGWKKDVFDIVNSLDEYFTLEQVYQYCNHLRQLYPKNKNIEAGIRRTLQYMRNDGLIEFIDRGKYKKI